MIKLLKILVVACAIISISGCATITGLTDAFRTHPIPTKPVKPKLVIYHNDIDDVEHRDTYREDCNYPVCMDDPNAYLLYYWMSSWERWPEGPSGPWTRYR